MTAYLCQEGIYSRLYMPFITFTQFARLAVKHLEVVAFHGSKIQNNILGLDFNSVVIHCTFNSK